MLSLLDSLIVVSLLVLVFLFLLKLLIGGAIIPSFYELIDGGLLVLLRSFDEVLFLVRMD